jgi:uncharacterized membrane protein YgaE (UPF0421/DUF939 family)
MTFRWGGTRLDVPRRWLAAHPRVALAVKSAVAAALAWTLMKPLPGVADSYPYYAPLGAVIAVSTTVAGSVRGSLQGLVAILLGASVALLVHPAPVPEVLALALVIAAGTILAGWERLGPNASWVPVSAMFVLILGRGDPWHYVLGYLGLTAVGALLGIGVNLLFPPLPLTPTQHSVTRLRATLAEQLDELAEGLLEEEPPRSDEWDDRRKSISPLTSQMRQMVERATEARRANWRAGRWQSEADRQYQQARALEQLAFLVEDLTELVVHVERADREHVAMGAGLRPYAAHALQESAEALRSVEGSCAKQEPADAAAEAVARFGREVRDVRNRTGDDLHAAATVVTTLQRVLVSLRPDDDEIDLARSW